VIATGASLLQGMPCIVWEPSLGAMVVVCEG
jgi:hypothetical protein